MNQPEKSERFRRMLVEDGLAPDEAEQVLPLLMKLPEASHAIQPDQAFLQTLEAALPPATARWLAWTEWQPWLLLYSQIRLIGREIWVASALILTFGVLVTLGISTPNELQQLPFVVLAPLVTIIGIGNLYDTEQEARFELEASCSPFGTSWILFARIVWIFAFNLIIGVLCSVILVVFESELSVVPLIRAWLLPMSLLSSVAFFLSVYTRNSTFDMTFTMLMWVLHVLSLMDGGHPMWKQLGFWGLGATADAGVVGIASATIFACGFFVLHLRAKNIY